MRYLEPKDIEVIQNFLQDAAPQGQIATKDVGCLSPSDDVVMTVPSGAHVKFTKPDLALAEMRKPGWFRKQPVRTLGEAEGGGMEGRRLAQLRTFESILSRMELPKSNPTGRSRINPFAMLRCGKYRKWSQLQIRGLLRSKTKKGPKRKYAGC